MFVALVPPAAAVEDLDEFLAVRREAGDFRWTDAGQLHVTLSFYESVPDRALDDLVDRLGRAARRRRPVRTRIAGGGAFPHSNRARVLWAGLDLADGDRTEVSRMSDGARAAANRAGIRVDGQRFRAHLTVARMKQPAEVGRWVSLLDSYRGPAWVADHYALVASHLGEGPRRRPRHEVVETFALGEGGEPHEGSSSAPR